MSWRRLTALVEHLPYQQPTRVALADETVWWGIQEHLLASITDQLRAANWQRGGGKGSRPKAIPRPGVGDTKKEAPRVHGKHDRPDAEVAAFFQQFAPPPLEYGEDDDTTSEDDDDGG